MELIEKIRREIEAAQYYDGLDAIYIKLMILKAINRIMGSDERKTETLFKTVRSLQLIYKEISYADKYTAEHFTIVKKRISNVLISYRVEPVLNQVA